MVMTTSGCSWRNALARSRRSGTPYSISAVRMTEEQHVGDADDGRAAPFLLFAQRPDLAGSWPAMPASPLLTST